MKLGFPPSSASEAVNAVWKTWDKSKAEGRKIYAVLVPSDEGWTAMLCWQKPSGSLLYKLERSSRARPNDDLELPERAFAVIPISSVFARVSKTLMKLAG